MQVYWSVGLMLAAATVDNVESSSTTSCHHLVNQTAPLTFLDPTPDLDLYAKPGHWFSISCCGDGFTDTEWFFRKATNTSWTRWPWLPTCVHCTGPVSPRLCDQGQRIEFTAVYPSRNAGWYKCELTNADTGQAIHREFHLDVEECNEHPPGGIVTAHPQSPTYATLHSNVTWTCKGDFGCPTGRGVRHANWTYTDPSGRTYPLSPGGWGRFDVKYYRRVRDIQVASVLTVVGVEESDYSLVFECRLWSDQYHKHWDVVLAPPATKLNLKLIIPLVCSLGGVTLVVAGVLVLYCCHKPQLDFRRRRLLGQLPVKGPKEETYYDATVIHHEDNKGLVDDSLRKPLEREHYNIFTPDCVLGGQGEVTTFTDAISKSMCIILVLSDKELDLLETHFHVGVAIACPKIVPMVVVEIQIGDIRLDKSVKRDVLKHLPHITTSVQWNGEANMSRRQLNNFLCTIKSNLPLPRKRTSMTSDGGRPKSNSSTAPLVNGQSSISSVSSLDLRMSHNSTGTSTFNTPSGTQNDDVFKFNDHTSTAKVVVVDERDNVFVEERTPLLVAPDNIPAKPGNLANNHCPPKKQWSNDSGYAKSPADAGNAEVNPHLREHFVPKCV